MRNFPCLIFMLKRSYICYYIICMTVSLISIIKLQDNQSVKPDFILNTRVTLRTPFLQNTSGGSFYLQCSYLGYYKLLSKHNYILCRKMQIKENQLTTTITSNRSNIYPTNSIRVLSPCSMLHIVINYSQQRQLAEAVVRRCSVKKMFLKISQNSQENTSVFM